MSEFVVVIPIDGALRIRATPEEATPPPKGPTIRMLVVDDLPEILTLFKEIRRRIRGFDIEFRSETSPQRAVDLLAKEPFDIVISDFRMRDGDGIDVLSTSRATNPSGYRLLMTGYNEIPAPICRIQGAGVDAYVQKPLHVQDIIFLLLTFLRQDRDAIQQLREDARHLEEVALTEESLDVTRSAHA